MKEKGEGTEKVEQSKREKAGVASPFVKALAGELAALKRPRSAFLSTSSFGRKSKT